MKRKILRFLKKIWILNFFRRIFKASKHYNRKYAQIIKWGIVSNEDTNYTYKISDKNISYLAHIIAVVTKKDYDEIIAYIDEAQSNKELKEHIRRVTKQNPNGRYADTEVRFGRRLGWYAFVRIVKPKVIVETGIDKGLGAVLLCSALEKNKEEGYDGKYYGTDINPKAGYLLTGKYSAFGEILYGDSIQSLKSFKEQIDLFINDSDHSADYEYEEYQVVKSLLGKESIILGDNADITDKLSKFSRENNRQFLFFDEVPENHWYPGAGIGISFN